MGLLGRPWDRTLKGFSTTWALGLIVLKATELVSGRVILRIKSRDQQPGNPVRNAQFQPCPRPTESENLVWVGKLAHRGKLHGAFQVLQAR